MIVGDHEEDNPCEVSAVYAIAAVWKVINVDFYRPTKPTFDGQYPYKGAKGHTRFPEN